MRDGLQEVNQLLRESRELSAAEEKDRLDLVRLIRTSLVLLGRILCGAIGSSRGFTGTSHKRKMPYLPEGSQETANQRGIGYDLRAIKRRWEDF